MTTRLAYAVAGEISMLANVVESDPGQEHAYDVIRSAERKLGLNVDYEEAGVLDDSKRERSIIVWELMVAHTLSGELERLLGRPFTVHIDFRRKWVQVSVQLEGGVLKVSLPQGRLFSS